MKKSNLKKLLFMIALVIIVQNGAVITQITTDAGTWSEENTAAPYSDMPSQDRPYN